MGDRMRDRARWFKGEPPNRESGAPAVSSRGRPELRFRAFSCVGIFDSGLRNDRLWPMAPDHTRIACEFLFHPDEIARSSFDPADVVDFWDIVNKQDWQICESVQDGMRSRGFRC